MIKTFPFSLCEVNIYIIYSLSQHLFVINILISTPQYSLAIRIKQNRVLLVEL